MPIYEYLCEECETRFEKIVINKQQEIACPKCSSKKASIQLSVFATAGNGNSSAPSGGFSGGGGGCCGGGRGAPHPNKNSNPDAIPPLFLILFLGGCLV